MKYCPNCGQPLTEKIKYCPNCGAALLENETLETSKEAVARENSGDSISNTAVKRHNTSEASVNATQQTRQEFTRNDSDQPQLGFVDSTKYVFQHAFDFSGQPAESRRSVFWWGFLSVTIVEFVLIFIPIIGWLLAIAAQGLLVSAVMRRLNYLNMNTRIAWLMFVPLVGYYPWGLMFLNRKVEVQ